MARLGEQLVPGITWKLAAAGLATATAISIGAGCHSNEAASGSDAVAEGTVCQATRSNAAPEIPFPPAFELPRSTVTVDAAVTIERATRELANRVPVELARESGRRIGAPGRVSYVVRRADFGLAVADQRLVVSTPVSLHVEVCKPIGPVCVKYGRCEPRLMAQVSVPLILDDEYRVGESQVDIEVTSPCTIATFDATNEIRKVATQQEKIIKRKIDASIPPVLPYVQAAWQMLHEPVKLKDGSCLRIQPEQLAQSHPTLTDQRLRTRIAATGRVSFQNPCAAGPDPGQLPKLPPPRTEPTLPEVSGVRFAFERSWDQVSEAMTAAIVKAQAQGNGPPVAVAAVRARGALLDGQPAVALEVELGEQCGRLWLIGEAWYDVPTKSIRVRGLTVSSAGLAESALAEAESVAAYLERHVQVPPPEQLETSGAALKEFAERFRGPEPKGVTLTIEMEPPVLERVVPSIETLVSVVAVRTTVAVSAL